jgi:hypothetical protein
MKYDYWLLWYHVNQACYTTKISREVRGKFKHWIRQYGCERALVLLREEEHYEHTITWTQYEAVRNALQGRYPVKGDGIMRN